MRNAMFFLLVAALIAGSPACAQDGWDSDRARNAEYWIARLKEGDPATRRKALVALGRLGPRVLGVLTALGEALNDPDGDFRYAAACTLGELGPLAAHDLVPVLIRALKDARPDVRGRALVGLGLIGKDARPVSKDVALLLSDPEGDVRLLAQAALRKLITDPVDLLPFLPSAARDAEEEIRSWALGLLISLGPKADPAFRELIDGLVDKDPSVRAATAEALGGLTRDTRAIYALLRALRAEDASVRSAAAWALPGCGTEILPRVMETLEDPHNPHWESACRVLELMGARARGAVSELARMLRDQDAEGRRRAIVALDRMGEVGGPALEEAFLEPDPEVRRAIKQLLLEGGPRPP